MDWETLYCPKRHCHGYGKPFSQGICLRTVPAGQPRAWCKACEASVVLSYGTAYYGLEADPAIFETAVRALAEGNALRATARIVQVDKDTVCAWLHRVACHCRTVMLYFWHDLHVSECQLTSCGVSSIPKRHICPAPGSIATRMGTPGCGSPLLQSGAWSWHS